MTQMFVPSNARPPGWLPTLKVLRRAPSFARSFVTVLSPPFATQMFVPSNATAVGSVPTGNVPRMAPSPARNFVTLLLPAFAIQILYPSNAAAEGAVPTGKVAPDRLAGYQRKIATWSRFSP